MRAVRQMLFLCLVAPLFIASLYGVEKTWHSIGPEGCKISNLVLDPSHPQILHAATASGVFGSMHGAAG